MKKKYEPPRIELNRAGFANKHAYRSVVDYQDNIAGVPVADLVEQYGSPLFVYNEEMIRNRYRELLENMRRKYPETEISWSYKTNYLGAICSIFHQEGAKAEVVSGMEYEMARRLGIDGKDIVYNGPGKRYHELVRAVQDGALIHIDHLDEMVLLEKVARELEIRPRTALRINMDTGIYPQWQRFGFNYDNGEAFRAAQRLLKGGLLDLIGLHAHIGTFLLDADPYRVSCMKLLALAQRIKEDLGVIVQTIDLGGGFASTNTLHAQYTPGEFASPSIDQYTSAIEQAMNQSPFARDESPKLMLETGRAMVDEAGTLIASIIGKKNLASGQRGIILDAGVNILFTSWWYNLKVTPAQPLSGTYQQTVFYGPLCMNIDVVKNPAPYPDMKLGDRVLISPVGAYNVTQWMQFIEYRPAVVLITETGETELIRERETLEDVIAREKIPEHLTSL